MAPLLVTVALFVPPLDPSWVDGLAPEGAWPHGPGRTFEAARAMASIRVDGVLNDRGWTGVRSGGHFVQRSPFEGEPARFPTRFRVVYDDEALFVGVYARDPQPERVRALLTRRDESSPSDWVMVGLAPFHDRRTAVVFGLNAAGVERDFLLYDDVNEDPSWDAVWQGAARVDEGGWSAEFRIPLNQLRFSSHPEQIWGLQIRRLVPRTQEDSVWAPWPQHGAGRVSYYGELTGLNKLSSNYRIEILPYAIGGVALAGARASRRDPVWGLGLDLRYGLSSSLTLSVALTPDFGQVEADPSEVNLTSQETRFTEKRPFFVEGAEILRFPVGDDDDASGGEQLFYSRRIGAPPHGPSEGAMTREAPKNTTLYSALKLSGKTATGWSVGLLNAVTAQETSPVTLPDGRTQEQVVEPLASYSVVRVKRDLRQGRSGVGVAMTGVHRRLDGTALTHLHAQAYAVGLAFHHRFLGDLLLVQGQLIGSTVLGAPEAIARTQLASQRYYQRPDARHLQFDPERTSLSGYATRLSVDKVAGNVRGGAGVERRSPGLELNDLGYQRAADSLVPWAWLQYRDETAGSLVQRWHAEVDTWGGFDTAPQHLNTGASVNLDATLRSNWGGGLAFIYNHNHWDSNALRGGPLPRGDPGGWAQLSVRSDPRRLLQANLHIFVNGRAAWQCRGEGFDSEWILRATDNLHLSVGPSWQRRYDRAQYVATALDERDEAHYIVGRIQQTTLSVMLRASYTLSPTLSLDLYAQPFFSAGRYSSHQEVVRPRAAGFERRYEQLDGSYVRQADGTLRVEREGDPMASYAFVAGDFNFRELRSNVVLRWEYLTGSSMFVIWSHTRTSSATDGRFALGTDARALAHQAGEHVVLVKLNYWFGS